MLDDAYRLIGDAGFWFDAAIFTAVIRVVWTIMQKVTEQLLFSLSIRTKTISITLASQPDVPKEIRSLKVLFIRYGNDIYLRDLASDQEKNHGRLRNKVRAVAVSDLWDGSKLFSFQLKVHQRLGTQFKLFVDVEGDATAVIEYLEKHEGIHSVDRSSRSARKQRIFFLLHRYAEVETVDGFRNNMIFPI